MVDADMRTTKLKITCVQMDSKLECLDENYDHSDNPYSQEDAQSFIEKEIEIKQLKTHP